MSIIKIYLIISLLMIVSFPSNAEILVTLCTSKSGESVTTELGILYPISLELGSIDYISYDNNSDLVNIGTEIILDFENDTTITFSPFDGSAISSSVNAALTSTSPFIINETTQTQIAFWNTGNTSLTYIDPNNEGCEHVYENASLDIAQGDTVLLSLNVLPSDVVIDEAPEASPSPSATPSSAKKSNLLKKILTAGACSLDKNNLNISLAGFCFWSFFGLSMLFFRFRKNN